MGGRKALAWLPSPASHSGLALPVGSGVDTTLGDLRSLLLENLKELLRRLETLGDLGSLLLEKLNELLRRLETLPGFIHDKIDQILPPETRSATLHRCLVFALTVVLPVALSLFCLYCCCKCFCTCCCGGRGAARIGGGKMMRAPGRMGKLIPRASFEADPRGYFINLRASPELLRKTQQHLLAK